MVSDPDRWVEDFAKAGASQYTFHCEASSDVVSTIRKIKAAGMRAGLAVKPKTPIEAILAHVDECDMVLVMTVEPGFGGQALIPECLDKVQALRHLYPHLDIQVDGGITLKNLKHAVDKGANVIVAGTLIFGASSPRDVISSMRNIMCADG